MECLRAGRPTSNVGPAAAAQERRHASIMIVMAIAVVATVVIVPVLVLVNVVMVLSVLQVMVSSTC